MKSDIILFTQWFTTTPEIITYKLYCLYKNLSNQYITKIILFVDNCEFNNIFNEKLKIVSIDTRLSYKIWMDYADKEYPDRIKILANSDVYFNDSLFFLHSIINWENTLYVLTRKDLTKNGSIVASGSNYNSNNKNQISWQCCQDAWVYKNKLSYFDNDYNLGVMHCDNIFRINAQKAGIQVLSLFDYIELIHIDWRDSKTYTQRPYTCPPAVRPQLDMYNENTTYISNRN